MARKADERDLGQAMKPAVNGERAHLELGGELETEMAAARPRIASAFPPIADYAFLSDCEVNCLIAPSGRLEWMCLPRPDSPSVFAAMLDRAAGSFRFGPTGVQVPAGRRYLPGTLVLETTWRIDPRSGRHLGNFPQAFSHLALINAVMHVIHAELGVPNKFGVGAPSPQP